MTPFSLGIEILLTLLSISLFICFVRLYIGPDVPDRTVAFDLIATHAVGIFALYAIRSNARELLDDTLVIILLGFLGTVMLARYLERRAVGD
jgi:multisubunit Na+/H+ antiporter MnhF subunit